MNGSSCILLSIAKRVEYVEAIRNQGVEISPDDIYSIVSILYKRGEISDVNDIDANLGSVKSFAEENGLASAGEESNEVEIDGVIFNKESVFKAKEKIGSKSYIADVVLNDIMSSKSHDVRITRDKFVFYIKSGIDMPGVYDALVSIDEVYNRVERKVDPAEVLADLAFDSYKKLSEKYKDSIEDLSVAFDKYMIKKRSEYDLSKNATIKRIMAKTKLDSFAAGCLFYLKACASYIYTKMCNLIKPGRHFDNAGDELMYAILLGANSLSDARRMIRGKSDRAIAKALNRSLVKNNVELESKIYSFFNDGKRIIDWSFKYSDGITAGSLRSYVNDLMNNGSVTVNGKKCESVADIMINAGIIVDNKDGSYTIDQTNDEVVSKFAVITTYLGERLNLSLYDIAKFNDPLNVDDKSVVVFNDSFDLLIKDKDISGSAKSMEVVRNAANRMLQFRRTEIDKINKLANELGDKISVSARRSIYKMQKRCNSLNVASEIASYVDITSSLETLMTELRTELYSFSRRYNGDVTSKMSSDGIMKYMSELDTIYNSYIAIINDMSSDISEFAEKINDPENKSAMQIFKLMLSEAGVSDVDNVIERTNSVINLVSNSIQDIDGEKRPSSTKMFDNLRLKVFNDFMDRIGYEHGFSLDKINNLKSHAAEFSNDIGFISRLIGYYHESKSDELQIAVNSLSNAVTKGKLEAYKSTVDLDKLASKAYHEDGVSSSDFVELDEFGIPTGYFLSKYKLGKFKNAIDKAHADILEMINNRHYGEIGYPISSLDDIVTDSQKREFANLFTDWKFFGYGGKYELDEEGRKIGFDKSGKQMISMDFSQYKGETEEEKRNSAYERAKAFNEYPDSVFAKLNQLKERERSILSGHKAGNSLSDEERDELNDIAAERIAIGSLYYDDGTLKTGDDLRDAIEFNRITKKIKDLKPTKYDEDKFRADFDARTEQILDKYNQDMQKELAPYIETGEETEESIKEKLSSFESKFRDWADEFYRVDGDVYVSPSTDTDDKYVELASVELSDWSRQRRFKRITQGFYDVLSNVKRSKKSSIDQISTFRKALYRAAVAIKRKNISRIALDVNGFFKNNEIRQLATDLDYAYDAIMVSNNDSKFYKIGRRAFVELFESNNPDVLLQVYKQALNYISKALNSDIEEVSDEMAAELKSELSKFKAGGSITTTLLTSFANIGISNKGGKLNFDDVAKNVLKPKVEVKFKALRERYFENMNKIMSNSKDSDALSDENAEISRQIDQYFYKPKYNGTVAEKRFLSSLSTLIPKHRYVELNGEEVETFGYGYTSEYIDYGDDVSDVSVLGLTPNEALDEYMNKDFDKMMGNQATREFYDAIIQKKAELDALNGVRNTEESKYRIPIREADKSELKLRANLSKLSNVFNISDGNLTDGQYMAIRLKDKALSATNQAGQFIRKRITPMSRKLEDMSQCSVNMLNSMHEYANRTHILAEREKASGFTNTLMGTLRGATPYRVGSSSAQDSINPETTKIGSKRDVYNRASNFLSKAFGNAKSYDSSNTKSAYDNYIDSVLYGIKSFNPTSSKRWLLAARIFKFLSKFISKALIDWKVAQSTVNIIQVGENILMKYAGDTDTHLNTRKAIDLLARDFPKKAKDLTKYAKRSKVAYLESILGLSDQRRYDRTEKGLGLGAATNVVLSTVNSAYNSGFNAIGDILVSDPATVARMFDFRVVEYSVYNNGVVETKQRIMQESEYKLLLAKSIDDDGMEIVHESAPMEFDEFKCLPDLIVEDESGLPKIDDVYSEAIEKDAGRVGAIIRAYNSYIKSSVSMDEEGRIITDALTQCVFIFRTWMIQKFYQLHGHMFTGPVYSYRDRRVRQGCINGTIARMFGSNKLRNYINSNFDKNERNNKSVAAIMYNTAVHEQNAMFFANLIIGLIYQTLDTYLYTVMSIDPDGDDKLTWAEKTLRHIAIKAASEHLDTLSIIGMIPALNKVTFFDIIFNAWGKIAYYKFLEKMGSPDAIYSDGEFKGAKKSDIALYANFFPLSDYLFTGNDKSSEFNYIYGNGGLQGVMSDIMLSLIVGDIVPKELQKVIRRMDGVEAYSSLGEDVSDITPDDLFYHKPNFEPNIVLRSILETRDIKFDNEGNYIPRDRYFTDDTKTKLSIEGKQVVSKLLYDKLTDALSSKLSNVAINYAGEFDYCKTKVSRILLTFLAESINPHNTRFPVLNMDEFVLDGMLYKEATDLKKIYDLEKRYKSVNAKESIEEQDGYVRDVIDEFLSQEEFLNSIEFDRNNEVVKKVLEEVYE